MESLEQKIKRVLKDEIELVPYDPVWPRMFEAERDNLLELFPDGFITGIEHIGSTSVPGLMAKPVVDMFIEITDQHRGKVLIPEVLEPLGYDCFWRPRGDEDLPPYYTWCIKRDQDGKRTHHLHFAEKGFMDSELVFRDIMLADAELAREYETLKRSLSKLHRRDRVRYTRNKGRFILGALRRHGKMS